MLSRKVWPLLLTLFVLMLGVACAAEPEVQTETAVETVVIEEANEATAEPSGDQSESVVEEPKVTQAEPEEPPVESQTEPIRLDLHSRTDPPSLDPSLANDTTSGFFIGQMFIGLTTFDDEANVVPRLATDWEVSDDGLKWTFHLRDDIRWVRRDSDSGTFEDIGPVTAQDVVYGVTRTLDPATASTNAYNLYLIEGAEAFNAADPSAENIEELVTNLGVSAPDETTVVFRLTSPAAYFPAITGLRMMYPQPQAAIEEGGEQWTEPGSIVTNGPYTLAEWNHGASLLLKKNPLWIDADEVQIDLIGGPIVEQASTAMALYENNELDLIADPPGWEPPLADMDRIQSDPQLSQEYFTAPRLCTDFFGFVQTKPPFDDVLVRKAFATAIDRVNIVENVAKGGQIPAHSFAAPGTLGNVADDMRIGGHLIQADYADQVAQAQAWLAEAGYPEGDGIDIILGHDTAEGQIQLAQAVQAMWQEAFPQADITIESQEWGVYIDTLMPGSPDETKPHIFRLGLCSDYPDQNDWLPVFTSESGMNVTKYNNSEYDALIEAATFEADITKRLALYRQAEAMIIDQDAVIAPINYYTFNRLYKPWLTKVVISPVGVDPIAQWEIDWEAKKAARDE
ncbi:MAG: peptide ABC transporter substrate-binding protein [Anaerolineales bacterium]|nr:peptide ABC transporter substrate-binding protein [Anaerolineales bacterium]